MTVESITFSSYENSNKFKFLGEKENNEETAS
jgi:hypothetical protein